MRNVRNIHWKQKSSTLPFGIGSRLKIAAITIGICLWGIDFVWVALGLMLCYHLLQGILRCLGSLAGLIALGYFIITHLF